MDPISSLYGATSLIGLGLKAFGTVESMGVAKEEAAASKQFATTQFNIEQQQEDLRKKTMDIDFRRKNLEAVRQAQVARSVGLSAATNQGAAYGQSTGYRGGQAQISGAEGTNLLGLSQAQQIGAQTFGLNQQLSQARLGYALTEADLGTRKATAQGFSALGGGLMGGAMPFSKTMNTLFS